MRPFRDFYLGTIPRQHPDRNLQTLPSWVNDTDRPISPLRSAEDLQGSAMKRVKGVEDLNLRIIRAQGIVGVGATTRTYIAWFRPAASPQTIAAGSLRRTDFFSR